MLGGPPRARKARLAPLCACYTRGVATKTLVVPVIAALALLLAACGGPAPSAAKPAPSAPTQSAAKATATATVPAKPPAATGPVRAASVTDLALPTAVDGESAVAISSRAYVIGGIAPDGSTVGDIWSANLATGGPWRRLGSLPRPTHDAAAVVLDGAIDVFGGGITVSAPTAWQVNPATGAATALPDLPRPLSDAGGSVLNGTAYIVGGFDGTNYRAEILAWHPGGSYQVAGHLPAGLRYAAVAPSGGNLLIFGGVTPAGVSDAILSFDPATGAVTRVGSLPVPAMYMSAAPAPRAGALWVLGGLSHNGPLGEVWSWSAGAAGLSRLVALPATQYYGAAVAAGGSVYFMGGRGPSGSHTTEVIRVR